MLDPVPPAAPWLSKAVQPLADKLGLHALPDHVHELLSAFLLYQFAQSVVSPVISAYLFPNHYPKFSERTRVNWDVRVVSLLQSVLISVLALWVIWTDREREQMNSYERIWGYTGACGLIGALGAGYFLWDLVVSIRCYASMGLGFLCHAICALAVFSMGFRPYLHYYGSVFILYELSSPFLNIHWFLDKLKLTGTKLQWYNGVLLLTTFAGCRLIWGTYSSLRVYQDVWRALHIPANQTVASAIAHAHAVNPASAAHDIFSLKDGSVCLGDIACVAAQAETLRYVSHAQRMSWATALSTLIPNLLLNGLNFFWFGKMIKTVKSRFDGKPDPNAEPDEDDLFEGVPPASDAEKTEEETKEELADGVENGGKATEALSSGIEEKAAKASRRKN